MSFYFFKGFIVEFIAIENMVPKRNSKLFIKTNF